MRDGARPPARALLRHHHSASAPDARLSRSAVETGAAVEHGVRLRRTVVLPGARVGRDAVLKRCLVGFGVQVPAGAEVAGQLITPATSSRDGGQDDGSRVGDLVFTPLVG